MREYSPNSRPVFEISPANYLLVGDKPFEQCGNLSKLNLEEIEIKFGFKYSENVFIPEKYSQIDFGDDSQGESIFQKIQDRLKNPLNEFLAVCFINEEVGYGVFATAFIEAGTIIGVYAGDFEPISEKEKIYALGFADEKYCVNARNTGGISRFIQHMPFSIKKIIDEIRQKGTDFELFIKILSGNGLSFNSDELKKVSNNFKESPELFIDYSVEFIQDIYKKNKCDEEMQAKKFLERISNLATTNVTQTSLRFRGKKLFYLQACCDIRKGEQLGINYGLSYWITKRKSPSFFYKNGTVINPEVYLPPLAQIVNKYQVTNTSILLPDKHLALRKAAANGDLDNVVFLLEYEANINEAGIESGRTALHWAVIKKHDKIEEVLLIRGANTHILDNQGKTPLGYKQDSVRPSLLSP